MPQYVWPETEPTPDPVTGYVSYEPVGVLPPKPMVVPVDPGTLELLLASTPTQLTAIDPAFVEITRPDETPTVQLYDDGLDGIRMAPADVRLRSGVARAGGLVAGHWPSRRHAPSARHLAGGRNLRAVPPETP